MNRSSESLFVSANQDLAESVRRIPVAWMLAKLSIRHRYQRSVLGPFWITISQAVYIVVLGGVFGTIFKQSGPDYLPFVTCGTLLIGFVTTTIQEASTELITKSIKMKEGDRFVFAHLSEMLFRNLLFFGHHFTIFAIVLLFFQIPVSLLDIIVAALGFVLIFWNLVCLSLLVAIVTLRFRDVGPLLISVLRIMFFVTPIMWKPDFLGDKAHLVNWNPLHHWINLVREPLTNNDYRIDSLLVTIGTGIIITGLSYASFLVAHRKIALWL